MAFDDIESGFLYKPQSDRGGLVVLLPSKYRNSRVTLKGPDGNVIEQGRSSGYGNGNREHFRFGQPGGKYPNGSIVEVTLADGTVKQHKIDDTSMRLDAGGASSGGLSGAGAMTEMQGIGVSRPKFGANIQPTESFIFKSPLSTLETIRTVSNIIVGATRSYRSISESIGGDMLQQPQQQPQQQDSGLTAIPGFNIEKK